MAGPVANVIDGMYAVPVGSAGSKWSDILKLGQIGLGMFGRVRVPYNRGGKDFAMRNQRRFSIEFKRQVIPGPLEGCKSSPAQLCRRYKHLLEPALPLEEAVPVTVTDLVTRPTEEWRSRDRVEKLGRLAGKLTWRTSF